MKKVTETTYCDRCGNEIGKQKEGAFIGLYSKLIEKLGSPLSHDNGHVHICVIGESKRRLDLCDKCNNSLAEWFNDPKEIGE